MLAVNLLQTFAAIPEMVNQSILVIAPPAAWQIGAWVGVVQIFGFTFLVSDKIVRQAGDSYAKAILSTLEK